MCMNLCDKVDGLFNHKCHSLPERNVGIVTLPLLHFSLSTLGTYSANNWTFTCYNRVWWHFLTTKAICNTCTSIWLLHVLASTSFLALVSKVMVQLNKILCKSVTFKGAIYRYMCKLRKIQLIFPVLSYIYPIYTVPPLLPTTSGHTVNHQMIWVFRWLGFYWGWDPTPLKKIWMHYSER